MSREALETAGFSIVQIQRNGYWHVIDPQGDVIAMKIIEEDAISYAQDLLQPG